MKTRIIVSVTIIILTILALLVGLGSNNDEGIKIGFVTTLSTGSQAIGIDMQDAFDLAIEHLNGEMAGIEVKVYYEDDGFDPDLGRQKTERLVTLDKVDFVTGYIWSNVLLASYKAATDNDVFVISANAGPSQLAGKDCTKNFFSVSWQNDQTPMAMGEVLNKRGIKNLYLLAPNYSAGRNMVAGVRRTYSGEIVASELTQWPGQLDFSAELAKIRAANPEAVWVFYPGNHGTQFFTQYAQAGLLGKIPLYSTFSVDALNLSSIGSLVEGSLLTQHWSPDLNNPTNQKFVRDFIDRTGRFPSFYAAQAYDSAMLIASAVEATNGNLKDKDALRSALEKGNFNSVRGQFKFNNNHFPIQNFYLREVIRLNDGTYSTQIVDTIYLNHRDPYFSECLMAQ